MSEETFRQTISFLNHYCKLHAFQYVHLIWHGGEPLTVPDSWYQMTERILVQTARNFKYLEHFQTSLIGFSGHLPIAAERLGYSLGSSVDFSFRTSTQLQQWCKAKTLAQQQKLNVYPAMTVSREDLGRAAERYEWFVSNKLNYMNAQRLLLPTSAVAYVSLAEHSKFLCELFDCFIQHLMMNGSSSSSVLQIPVIRQAFLGIMQKQASGTWGRACQLNTLDISPTGLIQTCPSQSADCIFGSVFDDTTVVSTSAVRKRLLRRAITHSSVACQTCAEYTWCHGACVEDASTDTSDCPGFYSFLQHISTACQDSRIYERLLQYVSSQSFSF
jgi:radical SAM protein with 4Fe4S-binding SPASM domain